MKARTRRRVVVSFVVALVFVGAAAAAGVILRTRDHRDARQAPRTTTTASTATTLAPTTTTRGPLGSGLPVSFAFGGDVHFQGGLRLRVLGDPSGVLAPIAPVLSGADVAVVNLETAITEAGTAEDKRYVFRAPPVALTALATAGVDTATLANNHGLDYGPQGLADTFVAEQFTGFDLVGVGHDANEAFAPHRMDVNGQRIAVFGATQVIDGPLERSWTATDDQGGLASAKRPDRLIAAVQAARRDSDTIVVYLHWGIEGQKCPTDVQKTLARQLVDAGADIVVGTHAHRQQGAGRLGTAFVDYGLGNFVFANENGASGATGVLRVTATGRQIDSYTWMPAQIRRGVPYPLDGAAAEYAGEAWNALRKCSGLAA
jgi:hypothetical protein